MYILSKTDGKKFTQISSHETLDKLVNAAGHYVELHGATKFTVDDCGEALFSGVCHSAITTFSDEENNAVAVEELSELQKEICKRMRGAENDDHMAEEIADAEIVIKKLEIRYGLRDRVDEWRRKKLERLRRKIEGRS